jgi:hypothetical protein
VKRWLAFALGTALLLVSGAAFPCGASFGSGITVDPHQDIIVVWKDGVETYAFQPIFCGAATDFGLILPVPASLSQQPTLTDQQAFTTAAALSEPTKRQVVHHAAVGCGGNDTAQAGGSSQDTTTVVASGQVGFLDWVELKADTEASFTDWLTSNGYPYSPASANVFSYYVQKGWYFIAFKISQQAAPGGGTICRSLGPVALSFPSSVPVVPSRMASASSDASPDSRRFSWRIFGITHGDAQLGFANETSYYPYYRTLWYSGAIKAGDVPALAGLAEAGDRLTRLTFSFSSGSSDPDIDLALAAPVDYRGTEDVAVTDDSACSLSAGGRAPRSFVLTLFGLALLGLVCWRRWR